MPKHFEASTNIIDLINKLAQKETGGAIAPIEQFYRAPSRKSAVGILNFDFWSLFMPYGSQVVTSQLYEVEETGISSESHLHTPSLCQL